MIIFLFVLKVNMHNYNHLNIIIIFKIYFYRILKFNYLFIKNNNI